MDYISMNIVPIGTKIKVNSTGEVGVLVKIFHYPTTFKVEFDNGKSEIYKTHEIEFFKETDDE